MADCVCNAGAETTSESTNAQKSIEIAKKKVFLFFVFLCFVETWRRSDQDSWTLFALVSMLSSSVSTAVVMVVGMMVSTEADL